jgi:hypothetical protein
MYKINGMTTQNPTTILKFVLGFVGRGQGWEISPGKS